MEKLVGPRRVFIRRCHARSGEKGREGRDTNLRYEKALDEALCYGWIDSGGRKLDDSVYLFRFCPRKSGSLWSQRNVGYVEKLEKENRMQPAGRATIEEAKANGRWASAYSGSGNAEMPPDFVAALEKVPAAKATWEQLNKGNRWRMYFRLNNLKTAIGREKRIRTDIENLARGETPTPQNRTPGRKTSNKKENPPPAPVVELNSEPTQPSPSRRRTRTGRSIPSYAE
jgi:uncharacterized protein YdeI (YjbR/CyaY-like superfamily)